MTNAEPPSSTSPTSSTTTLPPDPGRYAVIRAGDERNLTRYVKKCIDARLVGVDTETFNIEDWERDVVGEDRSVGVGTVGYCLSAAYGEAIYIPHAHGDELTGLTSGQMSLDNIRELIRPLFDAAAAGQVLLAFHNAPFDYKMIRKDGLMGPEHAAAIHCTATMAKVVSWGTGRWDPRTPDHGSGSPRGLKSLTRELLRHDVIEIADLFDVPAPTGKGKKVKVRIDFDSLNPFMRRVYSYAAADASNCLGVLKYLHELLKKFKLDQVYEIIERPLIVPVAEMRQVGVCLDADLCLAKHAEGMAAAAALRDTYLRDMTEIMGRVVDDTTINLDAPAQVAKLFFSDPPEGLGLPVLERSKKTNAPSVSKFVLRSLAESFPVVRSLITYRGLTKQLGAFLKALPTHTHATTGRVHANFSPLSTATGRFSCSEPNLQQLPREGMQFDLGDGKEYVANVRDVIVAAPDCYLMDADYSQIEYRAMAGEARETSLINGWVRDPGMDVHRKTASLIFRRPEAEVSDRDRQRGKTQNFSLIYGQGLQATADKLGVSTAEAAELREAYFRALPAIQTWIERVSAEAAHNGYSVTPFGRRRWIPELRSHEPGTRDAGRREAVNHVIQGGCADLLKFAIIRLDRAIRAAGLAHLVRIVMTIHDSIVVEAHQSVPPATVYGLMKAAMVVTIKHWPPISIDVKCGFRYGSLVKFTPGEPFDFPARAFTAAPPPPDNGDAEDHFSLESPEGNSGGVGSVRETGVAGPTPQVLFMPFPQITPPRQAALVALLQSNPGPHPVVVTIAGQVRTLGCTTSLTPDDPRLREQVGPYNFRWVDADPLRAVRFT